MKDEKNIVKSKTFWFNVVSIVAEVAQVLPIPPGTALIIANVVNIALRVLTDEKVTILPKPAEHNINHYLIPLALVIGLATPVVARAQDQPPPTLMPGQVFAFDYPEAEIAKWVITRFERRIDQTGSWSNIGVSTGTPNPTDATLRTYTSSPPALTTGLHTVEFRACNASSCSEPLTLAFRAELVPIPVINIRIQPVKP